MREIKFRAYSDYYKKMFEWDGELGEYSLYEILKGNPETDDLTGKVMQFTGLKDKNGREIYEGDIVKMVNEEGEENVCEIVFNNGGFIVEWDSNFAGGEADLTTIGWAIEEGIEIEVIGNIYQKRKSIKK